ncbi:MAG: hypothetical protein IPH98_19730 [Saprospiraceae bacterium]|nr:hypothetical protein [Candidatus Defluviibacterium haderslevense]
MQEQPYQLDGVKQYRYQWTISSVPFPPIILSMISCPELALLHNKSFVRKSNTMSGIRFMLTLTTLSDPVADALGNLSEPLADDWQNKN